MSIRQSQVRYGILWGVVAFAVGVVTTYALTPPDLLETETWRTAAWLFMNANWIPITGARVLGLSGFGTNVNLIDATGQLRTLYALPPILVTFAAVLTGDSLPYTTRPRYIIQNCAWVIAGYFGAALGAIFISGARPSVAFILILAGLLGGGLLLGSKVVNQLTDIPIFGITTLGGLTLIGLAIIVGGVAVISALAPILILGILGALLGSILLLTVRSV